MRKERTTKPGTRTDGDAEAFVRKVRRATRKRYSPEEKIRIVLEGMRGEAPVAEICRRAGVHVNTYHKWLKDFMEASKSGSTGGYRQRRYQN